MCSGLNYSQGEYKKPAEFSSHGNEISGFQWEKG